MLEAVVKDISCAHPSLYGGLKMNLVQVLFWHIQL